MYQKIVVPVDLEQADKIDNALRAAAALSRLWSAEVVYLAVHGSAPDRVASSPEKFEVELDMFAREQAEAHDVERYTTCVVPSVDVAVELDDKLLEAIDDLGADLVVMASHVPGVPDRLHLLSSNAAKIVRQSSVSVFVVR